MVTRLDRLARSTLRLPLPYRTMHSAGGSTMKQRLLESDVAEDTARILFLTYGHDAVEMAVLRCAELTKAGDKAGLRSWKKVLKNVRALAAANQKHSGTIN